jgi:hypothetical protein
MLKEIATENTQGCNGKGVLFQPHHPRTVFYGDAVQQHMATAAASVAVVCAGLPRHSRKNECPASLEVQLTASTRSVSSGSKHNSLSLNDMFKVVSTELSGGESEKDRIVTHHKNCIKTHEAKLLLEFIGDKYDCWQGPATTVNDRPMVSSERVPHINEPTTV